MSEPGYKGASNRAGMFLIDAVNHSQTFVLSLAFNSDGFDVVSNAGNMQPSVNRRVQGLILIRVRIGEITAFCQSESRVS